MDIISKKKDIPNNNTAVSVHFVHVPLQYNRIEITDVATSLFILLPWVAPLLSTIPRD